MIFVLCVFSHISLFFFFFLLLLFLFFFSVDSKRKTVKRAAAPDPEVNFGLLHMNTLKRYKKHYKLSEETTSKQELIDVRGRRKEEKEEKKR